LKSAKVPLAEILGDVSHDSINRFLLRERYEAKDLFDGVTDLINLEGGILSVDDTVIKKLYSDPSSAELVSYFSEMLNDRKKAKK